MTKMWLASCVPLLLWSGTLAVARSTSKRSLTVAIGDPWCKYTSDILFCDYKEAKEKTVHMTKTDIGQLRKVFLYNIKKLHLSESACMNVSLNNIKEVVIVSNDGRPCLDPVEFSTKSCKVDRLPANAERLYLEDSEVSILNTNLPLAKLTIINSNINSLQIWSPLVKATTVIIQNSHVSTLHKIIAGEGSSLLIQKSVINISGKKGLEINKGTVIIQDSSVITPDGGVILHSGGNLAIKNLRGNMSVSGGLCESVNDEQNVIKRPSNSLTLNNATFVVLFSMCLILLVLSWTFIAFLVSFRRETVLKFLAEYENGKSNTVTSKNSSVSGHHLSGENDELLETNINMPLRDLTDSGAHNDNRASSSETRATLTETIASEKNPVPPINEELLRFVDEVKTSYDRQREMYLAAMEEVHIRGENLRRSLSHQNNRTLIIPHAEELKLTSQKVSCKRRFLDFLLTRQMSLVNEYYLSNDSSQSDPRKKMKSLLQEVDNPEKTTPVAEERKFIEFREHLVTLLSTLTKECTSEGYKILLRAEDKELLNCLRELTDTPLFGNKAKRTTALQHISRIVEEDVTDFIINIQTEYEHELDKNIEYLDNVFLCLIEGLKN